MNKSDNPQTKSEVKINLPETDFETNLTVNRIKELHEDWLRRFSQSLIDQPITATVYFCIFKYQGESGITAKQLGKMLNMKTTAVYHHLSKLEEASLIISVEDQGPPLSRRYFENRPDVLYEIKQQKFNLCSRSLENENIKGLIKNDDDLKAYRAKWIEYIHNRFKEGSKTRHREISDLRRTVSIVSASAIEADRQLSKMSKDEYQRVLDESPMVVTMLLKKDEFHEIMEKINQVILPYLHRKPELTSKSSIESESLSQSNIVKFPSTISIMGLPPLVAYRHDIKSVLEPDK
ncbi:MAG: hypothetical protein ACFFD1_16045 [Candidatus Thorarchaeota archaeon]